MNWFAMTQLDLIDGRIFDFRTERMAACNVQSLVPWVLNTGISIINRRHPLQRFISRIQRLYSEGRLRRSPSGPAAAAAASKQPTNNRHWTKKMTDMQGDNDCEGSSKRRPPCGRRRGRCQYDIALHSMGHYKQRTSDLGLRFKERCHRITDGLYRCVDQLGAWTVMITAGW
jgi:hypothetical protein